MARLRLLVLGPPRLERDGRPIELNLRRALALLVYLAVSNRPHGREALAALLWPDSDEPEARGRLRHTLHRLTEALGNDVLVAAGDTLRLSPALDLWLDSRTFEHHAAAGLAAAAAQPPDPARLEHLTRAASLYVDDFLAGFTLPDSAAWDEWQFLGREHLRQTCARVLEWLVGAHRARGEWDEAIGYARRWLTLDPLHEPAQRALMQLYAFAGQQAAALRQYQECARILEAELGVAPEDETTALYEAVRTRRLAPPSGTHLDGPSPAATQDAAAPATAAPPPTSPRAGRSHNLPAPPTALIGRECEQAQIATRLMEEGTRLLTLTGPGGVGKTRLALQAAADLIDWHEDGVFLVPLASIDDPALLASAIAQALGVREAAGRLLLESIKDHLRERRLLLLLDNFEHLLAAAPLVAELLAACPRLKILATSRAALRLRGEKESAITPLALPDQEHLLSLEALSRYAAVALFLERARDARPDFAVTGGNAAAVAEICRQLDGLPLAIELAAARLRHLPPEALLARLERRLPLLTGGPRDAPARQRTLRDTIAWSHDLLAPAEQALFRRLAVFSGGCTLEAVEAICASRDLRGDVLDLLAALVDQSLLLQEPQPDGKPRFRVLATVRAYALERLAESGEQEAVQRRHASVFLAFSERAAREVSGPQQGMWLARLAAEHDNLRAAFQTWETQRDTESALRLAAALREFWIVRGHLTEGREQVARVVRLAAATEQPEVRVRALPIGANLAFNQSDYAAARAMYEESLALLRTLGQTEGVHSLLMNLAATAVKEGDYAAARGHLEESLTLARRAGDPFTVSRSVNDLANVAHEQGDYALARSLYEEALAMARQDDTLGVVTVSNNLAVVARDQGDLVTARTLLEESLAVRKEIGDRRGVALTLANLADVASQQGDYDRAHAMLVEGLDVQRELGAAPGIAFVLERFAGLAAAQDQAARALRLAGAGASLRAALGAVPAPAAQTLLERRLSSARQALGEDAAGRAWTEGNALSLDEAVAYALTPPINL